MSRYWEDEIRVRVSVTVFVAKDEEWHKKSKYINKLASGRAV